jgi:hypothetical protein
MGIGFDATGLFRTLHERRIFCKQIRKALGIEEGARITEKFAHRFFADLG